MKPLVKRFRYTSDVETFTLDLKIRVSTDFQFYYAKADVPAVLQEQHNYMPVRCYFDDIHGLEQSIEELIEKYEASFVAETREKIIFYRFYSGEPNHADGGLDLNFSYRVLWKYQAGNETKYLEERGTGLNVRMDAVSDPSPGDDRHFKVQEMPWTAEREHWFQTLCIQLDGLARKIKSGLGGAPTVLARKIDQNVRLLPGGES